MTEYVDEACVVLVREPERAVYVVGLATPEEAKARIKEIYPNEPEIVMHAAPLSEGDTKGLKLRHREFRPWQ